MEGHNTESGRKPVEGGESTLQESDAVDRYVDLQAKAYDVFMTAEERKEFAQDLIDLVKLLNKGEGMTSTFCEDLLNHVHRVEEGYLRLQRATVAVRELERKSHAGIFDQGTHDRVTAEIRAALNCDVPERVLEPLKKTAQEYLIRVYQQSHQR